MAEKKSAVKKDRKTERKVIVYSTPTCPYCNMAKEFLKENKVKFIEKDVSADKDALKEMLAKSGQGGVPVIDVDGRIIIGFDIVRMRSELGI